MPDCGCWVVRRENLGAIGNEYCAPEVDFCPLHAAAPRLAEALKGWLAWYETIEEMECDSDESALLKDSREILAGIPLSSKPSV